MRKMKKFYFLLIFIGFIKYLNVYFSWLHIYVYVFADCIVIKIKQHGKYIY